MTYSIPSLKQHLDPAGPKRILTLDGGGLRGIVTLGYLARIEHYLRERHNNRTEFRLSHYFDLIAGTSTGAIIAAGLARGMSVAELTATYNRLGKEVFYKSPWRKGVLRPRYSHRKLTQHLKEILKPETQLGDASLETGLLVVSKRLDTGSPWPLSNNPNGQYYEAPEGNFIANKLYSLWSVVRASTAAPSFFSPEEILISKGKNGLRDELGEFVDGGVSPHNNPALQAFLYATAEGYRLGWETGPEKMLLVSVGTGKGDPNVEPSWLSAKGAVQSLLSLMDDNADLVEIMMQYLGDGPTHRRIDGEIGTLLGDRLDGKKHLSYRRYDLSLAKEDVSKMIPGLPDDALSTIAEMDLPENMPTLAELARLSARKTIEPEHFPEIFDLKGA